MTQEERESKNFWLIVVFLVGALVGIFFFWFSTDLWPARSRFIKCMDVTEGQYEDYCKSV